MTFYKTCSNDHDYKTLNHLHRINLLICEVIFKLDFFLYKNIKLFFKRLS